MVAAALGVWVGMLQADNNNDKAIMNDVTFNVMRIFFLLLGMTSYLTTALRKKFPRENQKKRAGFSRLFVIVFTDRW
jgi:hypothetical protein